MGDMIRFKTVQGASDRCLFVIGLNPWCLFSFSKHKQISHRHILSHPFLAFMTADGPGMSEINGLVGHSGGQGCRLYCAMKGRRKPNVGHYYPACLTPENYAVEGCMHTDIPLHKITSPEEHANAADRYQKNLKDVLSSTSQTAYRQNRRHYVGPTPLNLHTHRPSLRLLLSSPQPFRFPRGTLRSRPDREQDNRATLGDSELRNDRYGDDYRR